MAQLIKNAAIGGLAVGRKKIIQPMVIMAVFVRSPIGFGSSFRFGPVNLPNRAVTAGTMNQPMHQAQQGRKQQHQGQIAPGRPHCHAPEDHVCLLHCHRITDAVVQAIRVVLQHLQAAFDHHRLHAVFHRCFGPDLDHALRPARHAE